MIKHITIVLFLIQVNLDAQDFINVISPNGGEIWQAGEIHAITWSDSLVEPFKIELYKNESFYFEIEDNTPSDGNYLWEIPYIQEGGSDYKIRISSTQFTTKFDLSDSNFTIIANKVTVTSPMSGDNWHAGTAHPVTWNANFADNVFISLFKAGLFYRLLTSSTQNDGSFTWTIAFDEVGGSDYQIRVGSLINSAVDDTSSFFTITANQITITSPNGGETWHIDSTQVITWNDNLPGNVRIELFEEDDLSVPFHLIASSIPSNGSFIWNISPLVQLATPYRIKITLLADNDIFDFSDSSFTLVNVTNIDRDDQITSDSYQLIQNYPNPFNPSTLITYHIPEGGFVTLKVYDVIGKEVANLVSENKGQGSYSVTFNASELPSGIYVYQLKVNSFIETKKMILMK
ncbi:MAG: Ser-Thr-rich GPI-anchored membrane family protein [Candidatus Kariarchaeaceae archaeon]|jgi:hypothetical protein